MQLAEWKMRLYKKWHDLNASKAQKGWSLVKEVFALFWPALKLVLVRIVDVSDHVTIAPDTVPPVVVWFVFPFQFRVASPCFRSLAGCFCCQKKNVLRQKSKQIFVRLHELSTTSQNSIPFAVSFLINSIVSSTSSSVFCSSLDK